MSLQPLYALLAAFLCFLQPTSRSPIEARHLFPVVVNDRIGYIDQEGKVVIAAQYRQGGEFSEGLAAVRQGGVYGYIDSLGRMAIAPQFDYATAFEEGYAVVYTDGKLHYIDRSGRVLFASPFAALFPFRDGLAKVRTYTGKEGLVDSVGRLVVDTVYHTIGPFYEGVCLVEGLRNRQNDPRGRYISEVGLIDRSGKAVVPFGVYDEIKAFENGYASVDIRERVGDESGETAKSGFIDTKGRAVLLRQNKHNSYIAGSLSDGRARASLYKYWLPERKGVVSTSEKRYEGYVNLKGEAVINDTLLTDVTDFHQGRAFVKKRGGDYYLIDTTGRRITSQGFEQVLGDQFFGELAFVYTDGGWGLIDRNGRYVLTPSPLTRTIDETGVVGNLFFYGKQSPSPEGRTWTLYGLAKTNGEVVSPPLFDWHDDRCFINGLMRVRVDGALAYIDTVGRVVWKGSAEQDTAVKALNIDFMNRGYCYASSPIKTESLGGWGGSGNGAVRAGEGDTGPGFYLQVDTAMTAVFQERYRGYRLQAVNNSGDTVLLNAQDSRLYLTLQALDPKGQWRDIEYAPNSWCGNSYHTLALAPQNKWTFTVPIYEGEYKTRLRAALRYLDPKEKSKGRRGKEIYAYSNAFTGSVNPGQFWRKPEYAPKGLMDPYNE